MYRHWWPGIVPLFPILDILRYNHKYCAIFSACVRAYKYKGGPQPQISHRMFAEKTAFVGRRSFACLRNRYSGVRLRLLGTRVPVFYSRVQNQSCGYSQEASRGQEKVSKLKMEKVVHFILFYSISDLRQERLLKLA